MDDSSVEEKSDLSSVSAADAVCAVGFGGGEGGGEGWLAVEEGCGEGGFEFCVCVVAVVSRLCCIDAEACRWSQGSAGREGASHHQRSPPEPTNRRDVLTPFWTVQKFEVL